MIELNRGDKQYTDVEKFKEYERTYCMAYEMAIRNDEVINTVKSFVGNFIKHDRYLFKYTDFEKCSNDEQKLFEFFLSSTQLYLEYHFFNDLNQTIQNIQKEEVENEKLKEKLELKILQKNIQYNDINQFVHDEVKKIMNEESDEVVTRKVRDIKRTEPMSNILKTPHRDIDFKLDFNESDSLPNRLMEEQKTKLYYSIIIHEKNDNDGVDILRNDISPVYQRPLYVNFKDAKERNITFNLALPTNELVDFIKRFKIKYDNDNSIVQNVFQLTNDEDIQNSNLYIAELDLKLPNVQQNYADMFFSYDCNKLGIDPKNIVTLINAYRFNKGNFKSIKKTTVERYIAHGEKYIDEQYYKHLVT